MRFPLHLLSLLLVLSVSLSGCFLEKIKLPSYQDNEVAGWVNSLSRYNAYEQGQQADKIRKSRDASAELRQRALCIAGSRPGGQGYSARQELSSLYKRSDGKMRSVLESMYWRDLDGMPASELRALAARIPPANKLSYPWNLVMLKAARKGIAPDNRATLMQLSNPSLYANPSVLGISSVKPAASDLHTALALPQSGPASVLGKRIAEGAFAGADYLRSKGIAADIKIIDTAAGGWQTQIQNLPKEYRIIGGPLIPGQVEQMKTAAAGRVFFCFTPNLPPSVKEGADAWHFNTSPEDQMKTLIDAAVSLGLTNFAVYAPSDKYGKRMTGIFQKEAQSRGYPVFTGFYTPRSAHAWTQESRKFLSDAEDTRIDAVFLPDSWNNMELLVSSLQYAGLKKKLLMGPSIWEQNLGAGAKNNAALYKTTIFPATWNSYSRGKGVTDFRNAMQNRNSRPDDWSALGFDFVQLASCISGAGDTSASTLNSTLAALRIDWAGAPFIWDGNGRSHRQLFVFRPEAEGASPADLKSMGEELGDAPRSTAAQPSAAPSAIDALVNSITKN